MTRRSSPVHRDAEPSPYALCLHVETVTPYEAWAFAQFLKRAGWDHYRRLALCDDEAYAMQALAERLRQALAQQGYAPR